MNLLLRVWRQRSADVPGTFEEYPVPDAAPDMTVLELLDRDESCGAHFRIEHQTAGGEALRNDDEWRFVSAWEHRPDGPPVRHREPLDYRHVGLQTRSYA